MSIIGLKKHKCIKIAFFGTAMVDHCTTEKLLKHFVEFVEKVCLDALNQSEWVYCQPSI